jgi:hypothetical protein
MQKEILGVVYRLPKEDVVKAINHWLTVVCRQEDIIVEKVEPEFEKVCYSVGQFEQDYREVYDGVKVVCKFKESQE